MFPLSNFSGRYPSILSLLFILATHFAKFGGSEWTSVFEEIPTDRIQSLRRRWSLATIFRVRALLPFGNRLASCFHQSCGPQSDE